jgi:hypothetical protein
LRKQALFPLVTGCQIKVKKSPSPLSTFQLIFMKLGLCFGTFEGILLVTDDMMQK